MQKLRDESSATRVCMVICPPERSTLALSPLPKTVQVLSSQIFCRQCRLASRAHQVAPGITLDRCCFNPFFFCCVDLVLSQGTYKLNTTWTQNEGNKPKTRSKTQKPRHNNRPSCLQEFFFFKLSCLCVHWREFASKLSWCDGPVSFSKWYITNSKRDHKPETRNNLNLPFVENQKNECKAKTDLAFLFSLLLTRSCFVLTDYVRQFHVHILCVHQKHVLIARWTPQSEREPCPKLKNHLNTHQFNLLA